MWLFDLSTYLQLFMYTLGIATVIPLWYLLTKRKLLHTNFRTILIITSVAGQGAAVSMMVFLLVSALHISEVFFSFSLSCYIHLINVRYLYVGIVTVVYSFLTFSVTAAVWIYRRWILPTSDVISLQGKFQQSENNRTFPVYFCISVNELVTTAVDTILHVFAEKAVLELDLESFTFCTDGRQLVDAYRIVFLNSIVTIVWYRQQKNRASRVVQSLKAIDEGKQYFDQLQQSWNATR